MMTSKVHTLEYWQDDGWYVGKLIEVPGIFSQSETLEALEENIRDAYKMMYGNLHPLKMMIIRSI